MQGLLKKFQSNNKFADRLMCFLLYIGAQTTISIVDWDEKNRSVYTRCLDEGDGDLDKHLTCPTRMYVGSSLNCGCGFRHAMLQNGEWPEADFYDPDREHDLEEQRNHDELANLIEELLRRNDEIELYGCWAGELSSERAGDAEITVDSLRSKDFVFRERFRYRVRSSEPPDARETSAQSILRSSSTPRSP